MNTSEAKGKVERDGGRQHTPQYRDRKTHNADHRTHTHHDHHHHQAFHSNRSTCWLNCSATLAVAMDGERGSGAALRRRERRPRAWQRHVRTAVQLALAGKLHHSANKVETDNAPTGTGKESWHGRGRARDALWPTPLPPGGRGGSLLKSRRTGSFRVLRLSARMMMVRRPLSCRAWQTGRPKWWIPPASSRPLRWQPEGKRRRSRRGGGS